MSRFTQVRREEVAPVLASALALLSLLPAARLPLVTKAAAA